MRILALVMFVIATLSAAGPARTQKYDPNYPVCMHVVGMGSDYQDCSFSTLAQCQQSASGRAAECNINPYFAGARESFTRSDRRPRRAY